MATFVLDSIRWDLIRLGKENMHLFSKLINVLWFEQASDNFNLFIRSIKGGPDKNLFSKISVFVDQNVIFPIFIKKK